VAYLLIRNIDPQLRRTLADRARSHGRSLSEEAKILLENEVFGPLHQRKIGTVLMSLIREEYRSDDLVFEVPGKVSQPPDFNSTSFDPKDC
jgi:plasmid stability protein